MEFIATEILEALNKGKKVEIVIAPEGEMGIKIEGKDFLIIDAWESFETELSEDNKIPLPESIGSSED